jgi:uncharacterized membrane protein YoaK (UPF0700 family)
MRLNTKNLQRSDLFVIGIMLAVVGGFLDAYTYILRGKVFANAQTGNIVLLGIDIAEGNFRKALYYLIPITAFMLGVIVASFIKQKFKEANKMIHWRQIIIAMEIGLLFLVGFLPIGKMDTLANCIISCVCAMQVCSFKSFRGISFSTTMCTGNLRLATEQFFAFVFKKDKEAGAKSARYYLIILFFIVGAIVGVVFSLILAQKAVWVCCVMLLIVFAIMIERKEG